MYAQGISASANIGTRRASLRASAYVGTHTCARVGVCLVVYAFVCERACVRACELVFVEFSGDGDGQPAAATAETACRTSESPGGLASMGSLPPPSLLYLPYVCSAGDHDRQPAADVSACRISPDELAIGAREAGKPEGTSGSTKTVESDCHGAVPGHGQPP